MKKIKLPKKQIKEKKEKNIKKDKKSINIDKTKIYNDVSKNVKKIKEKVTIKPLTKITIISLIIIVCLLALLMTILFGRLLALFGTLILIVLIVFTQVLDRNSKNSKNRKAVKTFFIILLALIILGILCFIGFFIYISSTSNKKYDVEKLERKETTIIYDQKNQVVANLGSEKREKLTYDEIPEILIDAIIATEDSRYFQHNGVDAPRFLKAVLGQLLGHGDAGGGSTITMQVSKNSLTSIEAAGIEGIIRKFSDIYLSMFKLEKNYTKQQILEFYVNTPYLGGSSYGIEQAAQTYFKKHASELNLAEASIIAGLFQAPGAYDPLVYPEDTEARRDTVLSLMVKHGYITKEEKEIAEQIKVVDLIKQNENGSSKNEYQDYIDYVLQEVENDYGIDAYATPLLIYTNLDTTKQKELNKVFTGETFKWANDTIQGGAVALDSSSGKILAIGAGRNRSGERTFSYATDIERQIGSTAKPIFDYSPGIEFLNWSTGQIFKDEPWSYSGGSGKIVNYDSAYLGNITLRYSLSDSRNVPAVKAFQEVNKAIGNQKLTEYVTSLGLKPELEGGYLHEAHSVGAFNGASPLQMAGAYQAFSNGGTYYKPYAINKIVLRETEEEFEHEEVKNKVMSDATAYMITDVLRAVPSQIGASYTTNDQIAAKTGTTNYDSQTAKSWGYPSNATPDGWIVGYTPNMVVAIWTGYTENIANVYLTQNQMVAQRNNFFKACAKATLNSSGATFKRPSNVISVQLEKGTTLLASENTPKDQIVTELFKKGTEPTQTSSKYKALNNVNNLKATYDGKKTSLTWDSLTKPSDIEDKTCGKFGYEVYFNDKKLEFTTNSSYNYETDNPYGTYTIKTVCSSMNTNTSSGSSVEIKLNATIEFTDKEEYNIKIGETLPLSENIIKVTDEENDVTAFAKIEKTIIDNTTQTNVTEIDTTKAGSYTITYKVTYKIKEETFTQKINITE